jgi:CRISPR/Cas system-associated endoribonuclease Cas2
MTDIYSTKVEVLAAIIEKGALPALKSASKEMQNDPDVILAAAQGNGFALQYASHSIRSSNETVALAALNSSGLMALQFLSQPAVLPALEKYLTNCRTMGADWVQNQMNDLSAMIGSLNPVNTKDIMAVVHKVFKNEKDLLTVVNKTSSDFKTALEEIKGVASDDLAIVTPPNLK